MVTPLWLLGQAHFLYLEGMRPVDETNLLLRQIIHKRVNLSSWFDPTTTPYLHPGRWNKSAVRNKLKAPTSQTQKAAHHEIHCCPPENACGTAHSFFSPSSSSSLSGDCWHSIKTKLLCRGKQRETNMRKMAATRSPW